MKHLSYNTHAYKTRDVNRHITLKKNKDINFKSTLSKKTSRRRRKCNRFLCSCEKHRPRRTSVVTAVIDNNGRPASVRPPQWRHAQKCTKKNNMHINWLNKKFAKWRGEIQERHNATMDAAFSSGGRSVLTTCPGEWWSYDASCKSSSQPIVRPQYCWRRPCDTWTPAPCAVSKSKKRAQDTMRY